MEVFNLHKLQHIAFDRLAHYNASKHGIFEQLKENIPTKLTLNTLFILCVIMSNRFSHNYIKGYPQQVYIYTVHARYNKASNALHSSTLAIYDTVVTK